MSDTGSINEMLIELENDEFSPSYHLTNTGRQDAADLDMQQYLLPVTNLPEWLSNKSDAAANTAEIPIEEGEEFSFKLEAMILREENFILKRALIQFQQNLERRTNGKEHHRADDQFEEPCEVGSKQESRTSITQQVDFSSSSSSSQPFSSCCSDISNRIRGKIKTETSGGHVSEAIKRREVIYSTKKQPNCSGLADVCGLTEAKELLYEAVVMPVKFPQLFQGLRKPWTTILLYGPPGTGKTHLAHAIAAEIDAEFYCLSTSDLLSSWLGESEKLIKELFSMRPVDDRQIIIFIDEIDSLCRQRTSSEAEHSRRLKTELLIHLESAATSGIYVLCATNCPWDLDKAFLRRFQRRIYIGTPDRSARLDMLSKYSCMLADEGIDWTPVLDQTEGYSFADLAQVAQCAMIQPIRELKNTKFWVFTTSSQLEPTDETNPKAMGCSIDEIPQKLVQARKLTMTDFLNSLKSTTSTVSPLDLESYTSFTQQYGLLG